MKKDKLFHLFYALSPKEVKAFKTFVTGHKPEKIKSLVEILAKSNLSKEDQNYDKVRQKAFKKLFPNKKNNTQNFRRLVADTLSLLNDFLVLQESKENQAVRQRLLEEQYKNKTLSDLFEASLEDSLRQLENGKTRDFNYHNAKVELLNDIYFFKRIPKEGIQVSEKYLANIDKALDLSYFISKLHYACQAKMRHIGLNLSEIAYELTDDFFRHVKPYKNHPIVELYMKILKLLDHPNEKDWQHLKEHWFAHFELLAHPIKGQTYTLVKNLCVLSLPKEKLLETMFDLYNFAIKEKLLLHSGYMTSTSFGNYVDMGTNLKKFEQVRSFIKENIVHLREGPNTLENIQNLYESFLLFGEGKFDQAMLKSSILQFNHSSYGLRSYVLIIKCLYETQKEDSLPDIEVRCKAFRQYLTRKLKEGVISQIKHDENVNFTRIALQLPLTSNGRFAKINPDQLIEKINAMPRIVSQTWLLEKIEALR